MRRLQLFGISALAIALGLGFLAVALVSTAEAQTYGAPFTPTAPAPTGTDDAQLVTSAPVGTDAGDAGAGDAGNEAAGAAAGVGSDAATDVVGDEVLGISISASGSEGLAFTGASTGPLALAGATLVSVGGLLVFVGRRREEESDS